MQLRERLDEIKAAGAQLLAIDPHEAWSAKALLKESGFETDDVNYPLLLDATHTVSAKYGVAFQMRIHTELSNRPATFIIDRKGVLRYERRAQSFGDRPNVDAVLEQLKKL